MRLDDERQVAVEAVIRASRLCEMIRTSDGAGRTLEKDDKSPVTVADFSAQALISWEMMQTFPADPMVAEENSSGVPRDLREKIIYYVNASCPGLGQDRVLTVIDRCGYEGGTHGRYWVLDPVDGTKGFLRGEQYAIALALIENGSVVLGVLGCPNLPFALTNPDGAKGCIFVAVAKHGAAMRLMDNPLEHEVGVAQIDDPTRACFCESVESAHSSHDDSARVAEVLGIKSLPVRMDSQCKYGIVARGDASVYLRLPTKANYQEKVWDHAAGWLLVKEAGGEVTDIHGAQLDFSAGRALSHNRGVVATNGALHDQVLSAIRRVVGD